MKRNNAPRANLPPSFFAKLLLPFAIPMLLTIALVIFAGDNWPRHIAPGSGLKLPGFGATLVTCLIVWCWAARGIRDKRNHAIAAVTCGVIGLMGWPVWSVGVLPSVNGMSLGPPEQLRMTIERTDVTVVSHSSTRNHWAWLRPDAHVARVTAGRYFIPEATYRQFKDKRPNIVTVTIAEGLLGAQVVTRYGLPSDF